MLVLGDGRISLNISAEVSELSTAGAITINDTITVPSLKVRRAETTLEMPSGGTLAMAGLLSDEVRQSVEGVPGLKNVPILEVHVKPGDTVKRPAEVPHNAGNAVLWEFQAVGLGACDVLGVIRIFVRNKVAA